MGADAADRDDRLAEAVRGYLAAIDAGLAPDPADWLARHPDLADDLAEFFAAHDDLFGPGPAAGPDPDVPALPCRFGEYELLEELGRGGMGVVYRAAQPGLGRQVALKVIRDGRFASDAEVRRFRAEAAAAGRLDHPHVVPVYEAGRVGRDHYFTMRLVEGTTLARLMPELADQPARACAVVAAVARAVHHAHQHGLLHRDLKPANILLDAAGAPYVTDFGLAKPLEGGGDRAALSSAGVGTPAYMAPEQASGAGPLTTAADVYSLGVILYQALTGRRPFDAESALQLLRDVIERDPPPPRRVNPSVDRDLETVCLKCLEKDPARRYSSAAALADDLGRWLAGEPVLARHAGPWERAWKWARRRPQAAGASAAVLLVAAAGFAGVTWQWREAAAQYRRAEAVRAELEVSLYVSRLALADREVTAGRASQAERILDDCPDDLRGWEWHYLKGRSRGRPPRALRGHAGPVFSVAFAPDGRSLASSGGDGTVRVWDARTGRELRALGEPRPSHGVFSVAYSPDGALLAAGRSNGAVAVWDARTGAAVGEARDGPEAVSSVAFGPGGRLVAGGGGFGRGAEGVIGVYGSRAGARLATLARGPGRCNAVRFAPGGALLAARNPATLEVWHLATGRRAAWAGEGVRALAVAAHPGGKVAATACSTSEAATACSVLTLRDLDTGAELLSARAHDAEVRGLAFSPDGRRLVTASEDMTLSVRDAGTLRELLTLRGHADAVEGVAFSPDGHLLASAGGDRLVTVWDATPVPDGRSDPRLDSAVSLPAEAASALALSGDGRRVAAADEPGRQVTVWEAASARVVAAFPVTGTAVRGLALDAAGGRLAGADLDYRVWVWDVAGGGDPDVYDPPAAQAGAYCRGLSFTPDGRSLAMSEGWNARVRGPGGPPGGAAWAGPAFELAGPVLSPDGRHVATAADDHAVRLRRADDGTVVWRSPGHEGQVHALAFSPDGTRLASAGNDRVVVVRDAATGRVVRRFAGHSDAVRGLAFGPGGTLLASGGDDRTVRVWDVAGGAAVAVLRGHADPVRAVAFRPDGRVVSAAGGRRAEARVWRPVPDRDGP